MGEPRSLTGFPLKVTCVPGCDEALSIGIFGCVVAQPKTRNIRNNNKIIRFLLNTILTASF
jgi:hypothetical protein